MKDPRYLKFQEVLRKSLACLTSVNGYNKLETRINCVSDWDEYRAILAQIDVTLWFKDKNVLKEIEPRLPHREGFGDILLTFSNQDIYCEVTSFESLAKSIESKKQDSDHKKVKSKLEKRPYLTRQDIEHEIKNDRIIRNLLEKTNKQLPKNHPGILALETGRAMVFHGNVKEIAKRIFKNRPQVTLIMLWSLERGSVIGEAPFWFSSNDSRYQNIGRELLKYLQEDNKLIY